MVKYEPCVDENITRLIEQLRRRFVVEQGVGNAMDVMDWATYWSLEVIYDLAFGERIGYVKEGKDVNGVITGVRKENEWWLYVSYQFSKINLSSDIYSLFVLQYWITWHSRTQ
jgi:hypothetical protein